MGRPAVAIKEINKRIPANSLLTAKEYLDGRYISPGGHKMRMVLCDCQCGGQINAVVADLMRGYPVSCGCVRRGPKLGSKFKIKKVKKLNKTRKKKKPSGNLPLPKDFVPIKNIVAVDKKGKVMPIVRDLTGPTHQLKAPSNYLLERRDKKLK